MSDIAIKAENVGKMYRLGEVGTGTISQDLNRWISKVRGKEDPFAKIGEVNDRTQKGASNIVWALKDVNFEIPKGEAVGIIGRNGAGKSTLLKLLSKVTRPSTGTIKVKDRIASLLEVGTGFHPEMTGRENVYLNGAILGMTKKEIKRKFDEIVDFSGVDRYIDTPVKRYSSGMYVRLAFAVAAHLESEILIIDEVLAVGDAEFQKKCLGKMNDVSKGEGRTVLFVSHNLPSIKQLCKSCIYLKNGTFQAQGDTESILLKYKSDSPSIHNIDNLVLSNEYLEINEVKIVTSEGQGEIEVSDSFYIDINFKCKEAGKSFALSLHIFNDEDILLFETFVPFANDGNSAIRDYEIRIKIPGHLLNSGEYFGSIIFGENQSTVIMDLSKVLKFTIEENYLGSGKYLRRIPGIIRPDIPYVIK